MLKLRRKMEKKMEKLKEEGKPTQKSMVERTQATDQGRTEAKKHAKGKKKRGLKKTRVKNPFEISFENPLSLTLPSLSQSDPVPLSLKARLKQIGRQKGDRTELVANRKVKIPTKRIGRKYVIKFVYCYIRMASVHMSLWYGPLYSKTVNVGKESG